jgi:hypothetical protein
MPSLVLLLIPVVAIACATLTLLLGFDDPRAERLEPGELMPSLVLLLIPVVAIACATLTLLGG